MSKIEKIVCTTLPDDKFDHYRVKMDDEKHWIGISVDKGVPIDLDETVQSIVKEREIIKSRKIEIPKKLFGNEKSSN